MLFTVGRSNKTIDDPPPIFSTTASSSMYGSSEHGQYSQSVDICVENEIPPPQYDDAIVIKPIQRIPTKD